MTTTLLTPSDTLTPEPPPDIRVRDLIEMLQREDPDAWVQVVARVADEPDTPLGEVVQQAIDVVLSETLADDVTVNVSDAVMGALRECGVVVQGRKDGISTDEVEPRHVEGISRSWTGGRKVVVVR